MRTAKLTSPSYIRDDVTTTQELILNHSHPGQRQRVTRVHSWRLTEGCRRPREVAERSCNVFNEFSDDHMVKEWKRKTSSLKDIRFIYFRRQTQSASNQHDDL